MDNPQEKPKLISSLPARLQSPDVEEGDFEPILHLQKAVYEAHIDDLQRRIERLHNRNQQVKKLCESIVANTVYKSNEDEKEFVEFNINIASATKRIDEDTKKIIDLEKLRENHQSNHFKKVKYMNEKFENRRIELYSQIKELNAKINMIENYKLSEAQIKLKYKDQNESIKLAEQRMHDTLNQIKYKSIMHKENLKKEAYKKILDTSETYQFELKTTVPFTVQRLMQENIVLQSELFRLQIDRDNMSNKLFIHKNQMKECKHKVKEDKKNTRYQIVAFKIQDLLLKKLRIAYSTVKNALSQSYKAPEDYENKYLKLVESVKSPEYFRCEFRQKKLEVLYHQEIIKLGLAKNFKSKTLLTLNNLINGLSSLKKSINSAISSDALDTEDFKKTDLEAFTFYLLDIVSNCESKKWDFELKSVDTVIDSRNVYATGDLGFEPNYIEIEEINQRFNKALLTHSPSKIFNEFDTLSDKFIKRESLSLSSQKHSKDSVSIATSSASSVTKQMDKSMKESIDYIDEKEMEDILHAMLDTEEGELEYESEDEYYLNYGQE